MSGIIHKVKDAVTGHHHDESKTSSSKTDGSLFLVKRHFIVMLTILFI